MTTESQPRSPLTRFLDVFFQEQNIRWMLCIGLMILLGSSLMLVSSSWDSYSLGWRLVVLLGYTAGVHGFGQLTYHSLGLRKTGTGLMALTVMLLPLTFHALRWIEPSGLIQADSWLDRGVLIGAFAAELMLCVLAANRIFKHFLRRHEPLFLVAYVTLCVAAAVVPLLPTLVAPLATVVLWSVFASGALRVNQHVFWMIEEHRWPRIFGFFPVLLLGAQFLTLFGIGLVEHITLPWMGFGLVLTAIPVLLAVDALARVFQKMHGKIARPFPLSIALPLVGGLALIVTGLCLAALDLKALVPAAACSSLVLGVIARRTQQRGFVWAMLITLTMAYQFSPTFFREVALSVVNSTAAAVREQRLPIAFYGLTYLPLLLGMSVASLRLARRDDELFAPVLRKFVAVMSTLLLLVAPTHSKALFPVGIALCVAFVAQMFCFRRRNRLVPSIAALVVAQLGLSSFCQDVLGWSASPFLTVMGSTFVAALLAFPGRRLDRLTLKWIPQDQRATAENWCEKAGLVGLLFTAAAYGMLVMQGPITTWPALNGCGLLGLLVLMSLRVNEDWLAKLTVIFAAVVPSLLAIGSNELSVVDVGAVTMAGLWILWLILVRYSTTKLAQVFGESLEQITSVGFAALLLVFVWPQTVVHFVWIDANPDFWLLGLTLTWSLVTAFIRQSRAAAYVGWINTLIVVTLISDACNFSRTSWLSLWTLLAAIVSSVTKTTSRRGVLNAAWNNAAIFTLLVVCVASLTHFAESVRIAGALASVALIVHGRLVGNNWYRVLGTISLNWQVLLGVFTALHLDAGWTLQLNFEHAQMVAPYVAFLAAVQAFGWHVCRGRGSRNLDASETDPVNPNELILAHRTVLNATAVVSSLAVLASSRSLMSLSEIALTFGTLACLVAGSILAAYRRSVDEQRQGDAEKFVWLAEIIAVLGCLYYVCAGVISLGTGWSMYAILAAGLMAALLGHLAEGSTAWRCAVRPLSQTGLALPAVTVGIALVRFVTGAPTQWLGFNSLALLGAGCFYFWHGLERRHKSYLTGSAVVLNVALMLLWNELRWTDPQFFMVPLGLSLLGMVELLKRELPEGSLNPLRYAGALVILVSPTFHIVTGSWLHLFSLMVISVTVALLGIGFKLRALLYLGTSFLTADLIAMVVRGGIDNPSILWVSGIALGMSIVGLAAYCERHREQLLQRMRLMSAELQSWR